MRKQNKQHCDWEQVRAWRGPARSAGQQTWKELGVICDWEGGPGEGGRTKEGGRTPGGKKDPGTEAM